MSLVEPLVPWAEGVRDEQDGSRLDHQLSHLFRAVPEPAPLVDFARQRVALRLRARGSRRVGLTLVRLIAVGVIIGMASAAAAQWAAVHWFGAQRELVTPPAPIVTAAALVPQPSLPRKVPQPAPLVTAAPTVEPAASAAFPPAPAAQSSRLGLEAASLEAALSALKAGGKSNAWHALQAIEHHLRVFPGGALELEARVARVDALLVLGRRQEARRELSALPIENVGRKSELRLIRAELRADDDCRGALGDFQVLVDQSLPSAWAERALFGRGACLLKLGDKAGAERDFASYLQRFPSGRFAQQIRAQQR
jgi:hypothetical protein